MQDVIEQSGYLFLATRMKRLADRMQSDGTQIFKAAGFHDLSPAYNSVLYALDAGDRVSVSDISARLGISQPGITRSLSGMQKRGLVTLDISPEDQRQKVVALTPKGLALVKLLKWTAWRDTDQASESLSQDVSANVLDIIRQMESALEAKPLIQRLGQRNELTLAEYEPDLAPYFYDLNAQWIRDMFVMEKSDETVLSDPQTHIIDCGGHILFVRNGAGETIGTGALQPVGTDGDYELTKMGVSPAARGKKAGEFLLAALLQRARQIGVEKLHLLTNKKCEAAIHLYEKMGFYHDAEIMARFGAKYERADVAMRYPL